MLLFETQIEKKGLVASIIDDLVQKKELASKAGNDQSKSKQSYFYAPTGSSPDLERAAAMLNNLRKENPDKADWILTKALDEAGKRAGPAPKGDLLEGIAHGKKFQGFMAQKIEEEIGKA